MRLHMNLERGGYNIHLQRGCLKQAGTLVDFNRKVMIVTDEGVPAAYAETLKAQCQEAYLHVIKQGEESKTLPVYQEILEDMLAHNFSRKDCVVALGGGVVGDLSGFVAASYMRGIDFINIPTTTLSQIDSSIGGKVAINLNEVKNIIGAFYQPEAVLIDPDTLATLPKRHYINGLIEALKAGLIHDPKLFELFEQEDIDKDIETIIYRSLCVKKEIVEQDETEQGLRKILNFGHTIGHAIESFYHLNRYLHGECVAMGMLYFIEDEQLKERVLTIYRKLKITPYTLYDKDDVYRLVCKDKKADKDDITVVKVKRLGKAELKKITKEEMKEVLRG